MIRTAFHRRPLVPALCAVASLAFGVAVAAGPAPTVDTIVADYVAKRGGLAKIRSIETLRQKGRAFGGQGREALVMRELKRPDRIRFEFTVQGMTGVYVADGASGWQVAPFSGDMAPQPLSEEATRDALDQADVEGPLVDWRKKGHQLELVGREVIGGREAYKLKLTLKSGAVRYEYIDVKSHVQVRTDSSRLIRGQNVQLETSFSDHKKAGGVLFPRTIEMVAVGRPQRLRVVVDTIEINPPLSDARFELLGAAKP